MSIASNERMEHNERKDTARKMIASYVVDMLKAIKQPLRYISLPGENCYTEKLIAKVIKTKNIDYVVGVERDLTKRSMAKKAGKNIPKFSIHPNPDFHGAVWDVRDFNANVIYADYCGNPTPSQIEMDVDYMSNFFQQGGLFAVTYNLNCRSSAGGGRKSFADTLGLDVNQAINFSSYKDTLRLRKAHRGNRKTKDTYIPTQGHLLIADAIHAYFERAIKRRGVRAKLVLDYQYQGPKMEMLTIMFAVNLPAFDKYEVTEKYSFPDVLHKDESYGVEGEFKTAKAYTSAVIKHFLNKGMTTKEVAKHLNITHAKASAVDVWNRGAGKLSKMKVS